LLSISSLRQTDLRPQLAQVKAPVMGMFGKKDMVVDYGQWKPLLEGIPNAHIERFEKAGHFIMLDEPEKFMEILHAFLDVDSTER
jgi:3-oxoadipate enol-lactonase